MTAVRMDPAQLADDAVRSVLQSQWDGAGAVRIDSPPGAGKTGIVERVAAQVMALQGERCMVATQTNEQAFDLARRLGQGFPRLGFTIFARAGLPIPPTVASLPNIQIVRNPAQLPNGPCVVIANAAKWSWVDSVASYDCQVVDEAFQLADYRFQQIAGLARRIVLVGDPGQIAPVVTCEIERWKSDPAGPHVAAPRALLERHPEVRRISLPVSRRLPPDTVELVQPAFYPELPFVAIAEPGDRGLRTMSTGGTWLDEAIDLAARGASVVQVELPRLITGPVDVEVAETIVALAARLLARGTVARDNGEERPLTPGMIGVVCAHVAQVNAVRERLPAGMQEILVETSDRFQGLERSVMLVHHPLSGRADASEFHLDAGRLCVMLSRHRIACIVVTRAGLEPLLLQYAPTGDRVLGLDRDPEYEGWRAHLTLLGELAQRGRVVSIATSA